MTTERRSREQDLFSPGSRAQIYLPSPVFLLSSFFSSLAECHFGQESKGVNVENWVWEQNIVLTVTREHFPRYALVPILRLSDFSTPTNSQPVGPPSNHFFVVLCPQQPWIPLRFSHFYIRILSLHISKRSEWNKILSNSISLLYRSVKSCYLARWGLFML